MGLRIEDAAMLLPNRTVGFGCLTIENGRIAALDLKDEKPSSTGYRRLIMPGLVNCHGHTAMTLVRGVGGGLPLQRWLEEAIFPVEAKMTPEDVAAGTQWGSLEMLAGGTTTVADMYDFPATNGAVYEEVGLKANICRVGLNFVPGRLVDCIDFTRTWRGNRVTADFCVHSEYLTDEAFCRALASANRELHRPVHAHVSETAREHEECLKRHGKTPMTYLVDTGLFDYGGYAAHCVYCTDDDFRLMAERDITLVHNPSSNMKLGSGFARVSRAIELGVNVALGTDGCASNDNLDMFEEMHLAALLHKGVATDPTCLGAWDVIEMATRNGARALGRFESGEIAVGKAADLCVVDLHKPHLMPALDLANLVVYAMHASDVVQTIVDGEIVYDRGQFMKAHQERAEYDFRCAVRRLGL